MLLLPLSGLWITMSEDEVDFVGRTAFVRTEHDCERCLLNVSELCKIRAQPCPCNLRLPVNPHRSRQIR